VSDRVLALLALLLAFPAVAIVALAAFWRRKPQRAPGWTGPFTPAAYPAFEHLVREELRRQGLEVEIDDGYATVPGRPGKYGLENLAQACALRERAQWPQIIEAHFAALRRAEAEREALGGARTFEQAAPLLAVRLWPAEFVAQIGPGALVYREDLPGLVTVLVYDLPETIQQVRPEEAAAWGRPGEELFALGLDNLRRKPRPEIRRVAMEGERRVTVLSGTSFFVASECLRLDHFPGCVGRYGAVVGVPTRHIMLAYPVDDAAALEAAGLLVPIVYGMCQQGPGSLSARLYWCYQGRFAEVPYRVEGKTVHIAPPEGLQALVRGH